MRAAVSHGWSHRLVLDVVDLLGFPALEDRARRGLRPPCNAIFVAAGERFAVLGQDAGERCPLV